MYEGIIETLIKLFAIVTDYRNQSTIDNSVKLVESYLMENFSRELVEKFMSQYHNNLEYFHVQHREILYNEEGLGERIINHDYLNKICAGIVQLFNLEARFMIVAQLLNFIKKEEGVSDQDLNILNVVANGLKIEDEEYVNLKNFYITSIYKVKDKSCLFIVNGNEQYHDPLIKHLYRENQTIELQLILIKSINTLFFKYWGPRNLYLNGHRLSQNRLYLFPVGGILRTSRIIPIYYSSIMSRFIREDGIPIIVYNAKDIEYRFSRKVYGLHSFSFQERSGDLVGILGGSGVGKTTLLNVLNGKLKPNKGKITINGFDLHDVENKERLRGIIGYVPQDDLLLEDLTVYKNLEFNARFCFGEMTEEEIEEVIEETLVDFDLHEARDLVVGSPLKKILSGGQRKRLNIALELMREPSVLFIDEPTSGLSSADSEKVMYLLKRQCLKGKLVIVNIHQPSSDIYKLFDRMIVMDIGGRVVFFGNPMEAITYFKSEANYLNPDKSECMVCGNVKTEQPLRIIEERMVDPFGKSIRRRKISPEDWYDRYKKKVEPRVIDFMNSNPVESEDFPEVNFKTPKWLKQLKLFINRDYVTKKSNKQYLAIAMLQAPVLALILGFFSKYSATNEYIFGNNDNIPAFLFMSVVVFLFIGLSISAEEIFKDRKILKREEFLELSRGAYIASKILMLFAISAIQVFSFVVIGYFMLDFGAMSFANWAILFSTACFANLLGLNLSAGLNSAVAIYVLIPMMLVPQLLLSGVIVDFNKMHHSMSSYTKTPLIGDLMASRWSYEALAVNEFKNNNFQKRIFIEEQFKNEMNFKSFYWLPEVERHFNAFSKSLSGNKLDSEIQDRTLVFNSIIDLAIDLKVESDTIKYLTDLLNRNSLNEAELNYVKVLIENGKLFYLNNYRNAVHVLDEKYRSMLTEFNNDTEALAKYRDKHVNKKLANILNDQFSVMKIYQIDNRIYQADEPIYRKPAYSNGRVHFYSSFKKIGKYSIDTVVFNVVIIWLLTILLMFSLYFDLLRKLLTYIENWRLTQLAIIRNKIFYNPMSFIKGYKSE